MKFLILFALFLPLGCSHQACRIPGKGGEITSSGYAEIKVAPDMARFTVEVAFTKPTMKEAMDETQKVMNQVVNACGKFISDSTDIRTTRISANKEFEWVNNSNVFKGYAASQSVQVTLRNLSKMEALTEGILEARVNAINNLEFDYSGSDSLRGEANALAMRDAKKTVQKMCAAINKTCDELVSARTSDAQNPTPVFDRGFANAMAAKAAPEGISVKPGLLTFSAIVTATYRSR